MMGHDLCLLAHVIACAIGGVLDATQRTGNDGQSGHGWAINAWILDIFGLPCNIGQRCHNLHNLLAFLSGDTGMPALDMAVDLSRYNREFTLLANNDLVINIMAKQLIEYFHCTVNGSLLRHALDTFLPPPM